MNIFDVAICVMELVEKIGGSPHDAAVIASSLDCAVIFGALQGLEGIKADKFPRNELVSGYEDRLAKIRAYIEAKKTTQEKH